MRKFYLYIDDLMVNLNGDGNALGSRCMFVTPTGLGVTYNNNLADIGNGFAVSVKKDQKIGQVVGKLVFFRSGNKTAYEVYHDFANRVTSAKALRLGYQPSTIEYIANVSLTYLTKTESNDDMFIEIPVAFDLMSLWYEETTYSIQNGRTTDIEFQGQYPSGVIVYCDSFVGKPHITMRQNGEVVQDLISDIDIEEIESRSFVYSSEPDNSRFMTFDTNEELSQYITNISYPELIFGRPSGDFYISLTDDYWGDNQNLFGTAIVRSYWRTV